MIAAMIKLLINHHMPCVSLLFRVVNLLFVYVFLFSFYSFLFRRLQTSA